MPLGQSQGPPRPYNRAQHDNAPGNNDEKPRGSKSTNPRERTSPSPSIGDYGEDGNHIWNEYMKEATSHDEALMDTWNDELGSIVIFAGLYSASLTAFLVESYKNLQADPAQQTMQFSNQSVALLSQISHQLGPNGGQVILAFPDPQSVSFSGPTSSDVRISIYWFISLVLSLSTVLFAGIIQQWVRDYKSCVFPSHIPTLDRARIRQLLYEGSLQRMSVMVEAIAVLIHISLFLFFIGLVEFLFGINKSVAISTTVIISISALLYLVTTFAPIFWWRIPYQSPATSVFWYIIQTCLPGRRSKGRSGGGVRTNLAQRRIETAMDESEDRMKRDVRAIRWIIDNLTEDSELQSFVAGIQGSLNSTWGKTVWRKIADEEQEEQERAAKKTKQRRVGRVLARSRDVGALLTQTDQLGRFEGIFDIGPLRLISKAFRRNPQDRVAILSNLSGRITRMLRSCTEYGTLSDDERKQRARVCIDGALQLYISLHANWQWVYEHEALCRTLVYLDQSEKKDETTLDTPPIPDTAFAARRACMAVLVVQNIIQTRSVKDAARHASACFRRAQPGDESDAMERGDKVASLISGGVQRAWDIAAKNELSTADRDRDLDRDLSSQDQDKPHSHTVSKAAAQHKLFEILDDARHSLEWARPTSNAIAKLAEELRKVTAGVLDAVPAALISLPKPALQGRQYPEVTSQPSFLLHLIPSLDFVERLSLSSLPAQINPTEWSGAANPSQLLAPRQLSVGKCPQTFWTQYRRTVDIQRGGMVFTLELLVNAMRSPKLSREEYPRNVYIETLGAITRGWETYNSDSYHLLVALLEDVVPTDKLMLEHRDRLPLPFIDELVLFSVKMLTSKSEVGTHVAKLLVCLQSYCELTHTMEDPKARLPTVLKTALVLFRSARKGQERPDADLWSKFTDIFDATSHDWNVEITVTQDTQKLLVELLQDTVPSSSTMPMPHGTPLSMLHDKLIRLAGKVLKGTLEAYTYGRQALDILQSYANVHDARRLTRMEATLDLLANTVYTMRSSVLPHPKATFEPLIDALKQIAMDLRVHSAVQTQKPLFTLLHEIVLSTTNGAQRRDDELMFRFADAVIELAGKVLGARTETGPYMSEVLGLLQSYWTYTYASEQPDGSPSVVLEATLNILLGAVRLRELHRTESSRQPFISTFNKITDGWNANFTIPSPDDMQRLLIASLNEVTMYAELPPSFIDEVIYFVGKTLECASAMSTDVARLSGILQVHRHVEEGRDVPCPVAEGVLQRIQTRNNSLPRLVSYGRPWSALHHDA